MSISRSNINLQVTRGDKMIKGEQKKLDVAAPFGKLTGADFKKLGDGDKVVAKMYGGQVMKRAGGGMSYQLYGGTSKNIRDGNKEVSQFYDKG